MFSIGWRTFFPFVDQRKRFVGIKVWYRGGSRGFSGELFGDLIEFIMNGSNGFIIDGEVGVEERVTACTHQLEEEFQPRRMLFADQLCMGCRWLGEAGGEEEVKLHPFVAKIESSVAVRSLPEEWCRLPWCATPVIGWRLFHQGRYERFAIVQKVCGEFEADTHEVWRIFGFLTMGGVFVFE